MAPRRPERQRQTRVSPALVARLSLANRPVRRAPPRNAPLRLPARFLKPAEPRPFVLPREGTSTRVEAYQEIRAQKLCRFECECNMLCRELFATEQQQQQQLRQQPAPGKSDCTGGERTARSKASDSAGAMKAAAEDASSARSSASTAAVAAAPAAAPAVAPSDTSAAAPPNASAAALTKLCSITSSLTSSSHEIACVSVAASSSKACA